MELCKSSGSQSPQMEAAKDWVVLGQAQRNVL